MGVGKGVLPPTVNSDAITKADPADWDVENLTSQPFQDLPSNFSESEPVAQPTVLVANNEVAPVSNRRPDDWESRNVVARRNILLVTLVAASGLLLAGIAFYVFVRSFGKQADRLVNNPAVVEKPDAEKPAEKGEVNLPIENPPESKNPQQQPVHETATPETKLPLNLVPDSDLTGENKGKADENNENDANSDAANSNTPPDAAQTAVEDKLPSIFEDFQRMFDAPSRGSWDDIGKSDRTVESDIALENREVLFREEYYPDPIPVTDWAERSQRKLASVKTQPMPLLRCILWFSKVSNTGISADWLELRLAGVDLEEPIAIEGQNASIGELLDQICQPRGLEVQIDDAGFPRVRPTQDRLIALVAADGILNTDKWTNEIPAQDRDNWVPLVIRMLDLTQCRYAQGRVEWTEEASMYDRARLVAALQGLKHAAANPPVEVKVPNDAFDFGRPESWWRVRENAQAKMPMDRIVHEERPVIDLLSMACEQSGMQLVIDWPAAWSHGLHPSRMSLSILRGRTLEEIANRYLEDYALDLVPLDSTTVLLTTDRVRRSIEQVIPIRLDRGMNMDDIKGAIRFLVPRGIDQRSRFRSETVPGNDQLALLRICLPALIHLRDSDLQRAFGVQSPNTNIDRE
ncbi:MAG: hypothetical protein KGQ51_07000 [Planctomycetes bacterium]|nr:hypothetical protein [Planctomycetota bacterium]